MFTVKVVFLVTQIILFVNTGPRIKADWTVKNGDRTADSLLGTLHGIIVFCCFLFSFT